MTAKSDDDQIKPRIVKNPQALRKLKEEPLSLTKSLNSVKTGLHQYTA